MADFRAWRSFGQTRASGFIKHAGTNHHAGNSNKLYGPEFGAVLGAFGAAGYRLGHGSHPGVRGQVVEQHRLPVSASQRDPPLACAGRFGPETRRHGVRC
jgi:hypothetical protein